MAEEGKESIRGMSWTLDMVMPAFDSSYTYEANLRGLCSEFQSGVHNKFKASLSYRALISCLEQIKKTRNDKRGRKETKDEGQEEGKPEAGEKKASRRVLHEIHTTNAL